MLKTLFTFWILFALSYANEITFKDFGAIWFCGDYVVSAEKNAKSIDLSNDKLKLDKKLRYKKKTDSYVSDDKKIILKYEGSNPDDPKIRFLINGRPYKCYYEYMERG